jgi:hypothetical protein
LSVKSPFNNYHLNKLIARGTLTAPEKSNTPGVRPAEYAAAPELRTDCPHILFGLEIVRALSLGDFIIFGIYI